jgi:hypothetical protein
MRQPENLTRTNRVAEPGVMPRPSSLRQSVPHYPVAVIALAVTCTLVWFGFWIWLTTRALRTAVS